LQPNAAAAIGNILNAMLNKGSSLHLEEGITIRRLSQTECFEFIQRCIRDIEQ